MEKFFEEWRKLDERVLEETMCDECLQFFPDEDMRFDPNINDGKPVCNECYANEKARLDALG